MTTCTLICPHHLKRQIIFLSFFSAIGTLTCTSDCKFNASSCKPLAVSELLGTTQLQHVYLVRKSVAYVESAFRSHLYLDVLTSQIILFVLNETLNGTLSSAHRKHHKPPHLYGHNPPSLHALNTSLPADTACQLQAARTGLHGSYIALLSTKNRQLRYLISEEYQHLPVVNIKVS